MSEPPRSNSSGIFTGCNNVIVRGGKFSYIPARTSPSHAVQGWDRLFQHVDTSSFHDSSWRKDRTQSLPHRYEDVLRKTMDWARASQVAERIVWLHGSSHASSIAQAVAKIRHRECAPLVTYFLSQTHSDIGIRARFIPTIAYQLGRLFPGAREEIGNIVAHDPAILLLSISHQLETLILQPLSPFLSSPDGMPDAERDPVLIIVNECDYLDNYTQECVIDALLRISREFPFCVRILLSSKSSARMMRSLASAVEAGLVADMVCGGDNSLYAHIKKIWKSIARINGHA